jgi:hypothetical protein
MNDEFKAKLRTDFLAAKEGECSDPNVWQDLAFRYMTLGANMNFAYCLRQMSACTMQTISRQSVAVETVCQPTN